MLSSGGYKVVVVKDAVEAFTEEVSVPWLKYLVYAYDAKIMTVDYIISSQATQSLRKPHIFRIFL